MKMLRVISKKSKLSLDHPSKIRKTNKDQKRLLSMANLDENCAWLRAKIKCCIQHYFQAH